MVYASVAYYSVYGACAYAGTYLCPACGEQTASVQHGFAEVAVCRHIEVVYYAAFLKLRARPVQYSAYGIACKLYGYGCISSVFKREGNIKALPAFCAAAGVISRGASAYGFACIG